MKVFCVPCIAFSVLCLSCVKEVTSFTAPRNVFASRKVDNGSSALRNRAFAPVRNQHVVETRILANFDPTEETSQLESTVTETQNVYVDEKRATMNSLSDFFKLLSKQHKTFALAMVFMFATLFNPLPSIAAQSGGRIGGSFPAQRSSAPVRTLSAPRRSYGYSPGFSRGFSTGFSSGYLAPRPSFFYPSPFYSPSYYYSSPGIMVQSRGPGFLGSLLLLGGLGLVASNVLGSSSFEERSWVSQQDVSSALGSGVSVAEISVAIEVPRRDDPNSILSVLDRISRTARTDSRVGIQNLASQVALELLRRKSSIVSASTTYNHFRDRDQAQREFNRIAIKERGKFERETVSKYGGVDYSAESYTTAKQHGSSQATMAVVTLVVAIEGDSTKMPKIRSSNDVEEALRRIATDTKIDNCLQSAEILWTPQERSETLTERDVIADYPGLRTL